LIVVHFSFQFNVTVIPWRIYIVPGDRVIHIGVGQQLRLSCFVHTGPVVPSFILWYRNDRIVEYDDSIDAKVTLKVDSAGNGSGVHRSDLTLNQVKQIWSLPSQTRVQLSTLDKFNLLMLAYDVLVLGLRQFLLMTLLLLKTMLASKVAEKQTIWFFSLIWHIICTYDYVAPRHKCHTLHCRLFNKLLYLLVQYDVKWSSKNVDCFCDLSLFSFLNAFDEGYTVCGWRIFTLQVLWKYIF
jgi:hypothetical protein